MGILRKRCLPVAAAIVFAIFSLALIEVQAQEPFYKGKRLTMLINFGSGGGVDVEGRLFARYLENTSRGIQQLSCKTCPVALA